MCTATVTDGPTYKGMGSRVRIEHMNEGMRIGIVCSFGHLERKMKVIGLSVLKLSSGR